MKNYFRFIFSLILILIITNISYAQSNFDVNKLDEYLERVYDEFNPAGFAVGVIKDGEVIYKRGFGYSNIETEKETDTETAFAIASCSKAFTAAAIGILVDEGRLDWNDRVIDYLPYFKLYDPYVTKEMRIDDLLCHRSGLATFDGDLLWYGTDYTREDVLKKIDEVPLKNSFRQKYGYSNVMFVAAGEVIKSVTGKTWDEFIAEKIFNPIGMTNSTTTNKNLTHDDNIAFPHLKREVMDFISYDNCGPAASINSSVDDLLKWAQMWLDNGKVGEEAIISGKSIQTIFASHTVLNGGKGNEIGGRHFRNYGLGWFMQDYSGRKIISHDGGLPGFLSRVLIVPEDSLGLVILENDFEFINDPIAFKILDMFMNDKEEDYIANRIKDMRKYREFLDKQDSEYDSLRVKETAPTHSLKDYAGIYEDKIYGNAEIVFENGELSITLLPTKELFASKMNHWHFDTFQIKFNDPFLPRGFVTFNFDTNGNVAGFKIELKNGDFHFYNLDFKKI